MDEEAGRLEPCSQRADAALRHAQILGQPRRRREATMPAVLHAPELGDSVQRVHSEEEQLLRRPQLGRAEKDALAGGVERGRVHFGGRSRSGRSAPDDVWAVGGPGIVLHFDGTVWTRLGWEP